MSLLLLTSQGCAGQRESGPDDQAIEPVDAARVRAADPAIQTLIRDAGYERYRVDFDDTDMRRGDEDALVTVVVFMDFQCPYCKPFMETLHEVMADARDTRVVLRQLPLTRLHPEAMMAAQAILAANAQDPTRAWRLHDLIFEHQDTLSLDTVSRLAREAGLDALRIAADIKAETFLNAVLEDREYAFERGIRSTPSFFINGRRLRSRSVDAIRDAIEEERALATEMIRAGASREAVYAHLMDSANSGPIPLVRKKRRRGPDPSVNFAVPPGDGPSRGPDDALVTIVEFSDFQCPFCSRVNPTLDKILEAYPRDVRVVYRNLPLPMHKDAKTAARAGLAAHAQGKFWEMHDAMFAQQTALTASDLTALAEALGMSRARFKADMNSEKSASAVEADMEVAMKFGARGTPAFFINGRFVSGARPLEQFTAVIEEELVKARAFVEEREGDRRDLYAAMSRCWVQEYVAPPPPPVADHERRQLRFGDLPRQGAKKPRVTIVECADFDCPFSKRAAPTVRAILDAYGDTVSVSFAHKPLPMHTLAEPAHRAAVAAQQQGKFWEMHDLLFEHPEKRTEGDFVRFATELGLDVPRFRRDWANAGATVASQRRTCDRHGVGGVPAFFINGRLMTGAQPFEKFVEVIDEELAGGFEAAETPAAAE